MRDGNGRKDATVRAPAARAGASAKLPGSGLYVPGSDDMAAIVSREPALQAADDGDVVAEQARTIHRLEQEKKTLQYACSTISTAAVAMAMMLHENGVGKGDTVVIPRDFIDKATGARVAMDEFGDDVRVRISTKVERDFAIGD